jgi:hypothetical protein
MIYVNVKFEGKLGDLGYIVIGFEVAANCEKPYRLYSIYHFSFSLMTIKQIA